MARQFSDREKAFKIWLRTRNKAEVARQLGVHLTTVFKWSKDDKWEEKAKDLKIKLKSHLEFLQKCADDETLRILSMDFAFLDFLQAKVSQALVNNQIEPKTWRDILATQDFIFKWRFQLLGLKDTLKKIGAKSVTDVPKEALSIEVEDEETNTRRPS